MVEEKKTEDYFSRTAELSPEREIEIPEEEEHHRSLLEVEEETPGATDLQVTLKRLYPKFENEIINMVAVAVMVGRVSPDTFLPRIRMTWMSIMKTVFARRLNADPMMVLNLVTTAFEIGLDGKGRIDAIELAGAAKESEDLERMSKSLGGLD